jgi:hypothetical protein
MDQSSWVATTHSAIQENFHLLMNPKFRYRVHKSWPLDPAPEPDESNPFPHTLFNTQG